MWMNIDLNVRAYLIVFSRSPDDDLLMAATACFIVAGLLLCAISVCALFAMFRNTPSLLIIVSLLNMTSPLMQNLFAGLRYLWYFVTLPIIYYFLVFWLWTFFIAVYCRFFPYPSHGNHNWILDCRIQPWCKSMRSFSQNGSLNIVFGFSFSSGNLMFCTVLLLMSHLWL